MFSSKDIKVTLSLINRCGICTLTDRFEVIPSGTQGMFSYISAFYKAGSSNPIMGGGILGGIIAIPLYLGFNLPVAYAVLIGITAIFAIIISGVTFSSLIIATKELIVDERTNLRNLSNFSIKLCLLFLLFRKTSWKFTL